MLIREACDATGLTKKAVEYYIEQGLINPAALENGYRDFSAGDIERLIKTAVLRRLGLGVEEIRSVLADASGEILQKLSVRYRIRLKRDAVRQALIGQLGVRQDWYAIKERVESLEKTTTIAERLLEAFPGYYGRFISLHFAGFLNQPIETREQQEAFREIVRFLDGAPAMVFPEDVQRYLTEDTKDIGAQTMEDIGGKMKRSLENMEAFLSENKAALESYIQYRRSEEFRNSPAYRFQTLIKEFNTASGYYEIFIPAMKRLSPAYAEYCVRLEAANEKLKAVYPDAAEALSGD